MASNTGAIRITWKFEPLTERLALATKAGPQAMRSALNSAASQARREFIQSVPPDVSSKMTTAPVRKQVTPIKRASTTDFTASFKVSSRGFSHMPDLLKHERGNRHKKGVVVASTAAVTGGGSSRLTLRKGFVIVANRGRVILTRGKGLAKPKRVYSMAPRALLAQPNAVPRQQWEKTATSQLSTQLNAKLGAVMGGQQVFSFGGVDE